MGEYYILFVVPSYKDIKRECAKIEERLNETRFSCCNRKVTEQSISIEYSVSEQVTIYFVPKNKLWDILGCEFGHIILPNCKLTREQVGILMSRKKQECSQSFYKFIKEAFGWPCW